MRSYVPVGSPRDGAVTASATTPSAANRRSTMKNAAPRTMKNNGHTQNASHAHRSPRRNAVVAIATVRTTATALYVAVRSAASCSTPSSNQTTREDPEQRREDGEQDEDHPRVPAECLHEFLLRQDASGTGAAAAWSVDLRRLNTVRARRRLRHRSASAPRAHRAELWCHGLDISWQPTPA